ncbi:MAG: RNA polymerase sigma-70 factor [Mangrovibacterium sp.]
MKRYQNNIPLAKKPLFDDEKMFEFIFKAYFLRLMAFAGKFIANRSDAEDIIQEIFLKVWTRRKEIEEDTFQSYLFTLVRNACLNHIKHQHIVDNHRVESEDSAKEEVLYYVDFFSDPYHQTVFNEMQNEIETVIQHLPEQTRKIFQLSRIEGMKNTEIAKMLDISIRTVEKHNTRALQKLKTHLSVHYLYALTVLDLIKELNS